MVFSNVPGAVNPITLCGKTLRGTQVVFHNLVPQVTLISYGGSIFANMSVDPDVVRGGSKLLPKLFLDELRELAHEFSVPCEDDDMLAPLSGGGFFGMITD